MEDKLFQILSLASINFVDFVFRNRDALCLATANKAYFYLLSPQINNRFYFRRGHADIEFKWYIPRKYLGLATTNLVANNSLVTHIKDLQRFHNFFPPSLSHLSFDRFFDENIDFTNAPKLLYLSFGRYFNSRISNLPTSLEYLSFGEAYTNEIPPLPPSLTYLKTGEDYERPLPILPPTITHLILKGYNSHPFPILPTSLKVFSFVNYNIKTSIETINSISPEVMVYLTFQQNDPDLIHITDALPAQVHKLYFKGAFNEQIMFPLPHFLSKLSSRVYPHPLPKLPSSLKRLVFHYDDQSHPEVHFPDLTHLSFTPSSTICKAISLPVTLVHLALPDTFSLPLDNLPLSLTYLHTGNAFNHPLNNLPNNLEVLILGDGFNKPVNDLPPSLKQITFGASFNKPVDRLPAGLEELILGDDFNCSVSMLPQSLLHLTFLGKHFNQPLSHLPHFLVSLEFGGTQIPMDTIQYAVKSLSYLNSFQCVGLDVWQFLSE